MKFVFVTPEQKASNLNAFESVVKVASIGLTPIAPLTHWYSMCRIQPKGGYWYFACECRSCKRLSPIFLDFSDGNLGSPFKGYGFLVTCYFCATENRFDSEKVLSIRWPLSPGQAPVTTEYSNQPILKYQNDEEYHPLSGPLHHYTSTEALISIIKSKSLWATNIYYLNDTSESELGLKLMKEVAQEALSNSNGDDRDVLSLFIDWINSYDSTSAVYVLSFSEAKNKLSQWRGYTAHGQGACLSIDSSLLVNLMQAQGWTFQNCRYTRPSQLTWAEAILSRIRREATTLIANTNDDRKQIFYRVLRKNLSDLLQVAATIKHEAFADECETRFISPLLDINDPKVTYRSRKEIQIPYINFQLDHGKQGLNFHEIMVGPGQNQIENQNMISKAIKEYGVRGRCSLTRSEIPYREL